MIKFSIIIIVGFGWLIFPFSVSAAENELEYKAEVYGYFPSVKATLPTDTEIELSPDDIFDNLDFTFLGVFQARKGDWAFIADFTYLKISIEEEVQTTVDPMPGNSLIIPSSVDLEVEMEPWFLNLASAYRISKTDTYDVQLLAGVRYLSLEMNVTLDTSLIPDEKFLGGSDDVWDAIIGVRGQTELNDKWWMSYRFDIGTGKSNFTL